VRSGVTTLAPNELVIAIEIPVPARRMGAVHVRRTRRRGHDLASVTLCCSVDETGVTRLAYGSVGPRPFCTSTRAACWPIPTGPMRPRRRSSSGCSGTPVRPNDRCGRAPNTAWRCSACSARGRCVRPSSALLQNGRWKHERHGQYPSHRDHVNGRRHALDVAVHHTLLDVLRDDLELTGTKECCLVGECGACTVMVNGRIVDSCLMLAVEADGAEIVTVEGLAKDGKLSPLQQAFLDKGAAQCGFCTPGQLMAAQALLAGIRIQVSTRSRRASPATSAGAAATSRSPTQSCPSQKGNTDEHAFHWDFPQPRRGLWTGHRPPGIRRRYSGTGCPRGQARHTRLRPSEDHLDRYIRRRER